MTRVDFLHDVTDKLAAAARLAARCYAEQHRAVVFLDRADLAMRLDRQLWCQPALGFLPHVMADSPLAGDTPILLALPGMPLAHFDWMINLGPELPPDFSRFERIIELVGADEADRIPARQRYRHYRDRGYPLTADTYAGQEPPDGR